MSKYEQAIYSWIAKREEGVTAADIPEIKYIFFQHLRPAINQNRIEEIEKMLSDLATVLSTSGGTVAGKGGTIRYKGTNTFLNYLYEKIFEAIHEQYKKATNEIVRGMRKPNRTDFERVRLLQLPNRFFSSWIENYVPDVTVPQESLKIGERQKLTPQTKRQFEKPAKSVIRKPRVRKQDLPISPAEGGPFKVTEPLTVARYQDWPSKFLMFQPLKEGSESSGGNEGLGEMVYGTLKMLRSLAENDQLPERLDDLVLLRQQARFWIEEFFNFILAPCDFANPSDIQIDQMYSKYRIHIMVPLIKLALFTSNQQEVNKLREASQKETKSDEVYQRLMSPIMTTPQWREYLTVHFPDAARVLFNESPTPQALAFYQRYGQIVSTLRRIQELFVDRPAASPTRPDRLDMGRARKRKAPEVEVVIIDDEEDEVDVDEVVIIDDDGIEDNEEEVEFIDIVN